MSYELSRSTVTQRYDVWGIAIDLWLNNILYGIGPGNFLDYNNYYGLLEYKYKIVVHNSYLTILVEYGLFGFIFFMGIVLSAYTKLMTIQTDMINNDRLKKLIFVWRGVFSYLLVISFKGDYFYLKSFWFCVSIAMIIVSFLKIIMNTNSLKKNVFLLINKYA